MNQQALLQLVQDAGQKIMDIYSKDIDVETKEDNSPLTQADMASHHCLVDGLARLTPEIPVLSEESDDEIKSERLTWDKYWLIDPLDGTKEFIKKNGEFTVNLALIENNRAIFGVVFAPALNLIYWGSVEDIGEIKKGAWAQFGGNAPKAINVSVNPTILEEWKVVGSRSHQSEEFIAFMEKLPDADIVSMGSSLKLCLVAEGKANLYPRLGLTSEWDTAAAQAVVEASGGQVLEYPSLDPLRYNTRSETLLNPFFIVCSQVDERWAS